MGNPEQALGLRSGQEAVCDGLKAFGLTQFLRKAVFVLLVPDPQVQVAALLDGTGAVVNEWAVLQGLKAREFLELKKGNAFTRDAVIGAQASGHDHARRTDPGGPEARCGFAQGGVCPCWVID